MLIEISISATATSAEEDKKSQLNDALRSDHAFEDQQCRSEGDSRPHDVQDDGCETEDRQCRSEGHSPPHDVQDDGCETEDENTTDVDDLPSSDGSGADAAAKDRSKKERFEMKIPVDEWRGDVVGRRSEDAERVDRRHG